MKPIRSLRFRLVTILFIGLLASRSQSAQLIDDRAVTVHSAREVAEKRRALVQYIWGSEGFPDHRLPEVVLTNVASPVQRLGSLARVDEFRIDLAPGLQGLAYHFIPQHPKRELVVLHHGHACTLDDDPSPKDIGYGLQRTIDALLREGYGVLGVFMPHMRPGDCTGGHDAMFQMKTAGSPIKYFLEPTAISLNYLKTSSRSGSFPKYRAFHMAGLSGGGPRQSTPRLTRPSAAVSLWRAQFLCICAPGAPLVTANSSNPRSIASPVIRTFTSLALTAAVASRCKSSSAVTTVALARHNTTRKAPACPMPKRCANMKRA
jgi:hypothetical protein